MPEPRAAELERGRDAYARHAWEEALAHLSRADAEQELEPADRLRLAHASYWTGSLDAYLAALERAYAGFIAHGDQPQAALAALMLHWDNLNKPAASLARGWYRRAERILRDAPECVAHGYLAQARLWDALAAGDTEQAVREARTMSILGERLGDRDLEVLGLLRLGQALVADGDAGAGLDCLDEAVVAAIAGELGTMTTAAVYCGAISCCRELADYGRTGQWSAAVVRWCERESCTGFPGLCRIYTAELTALRGEWADAECELVRAADELERFGAGAFAASALYELAEIHRRRGDLAAAVAAYERACELGLDAQPGLALLWLAQGDAEAAAGAVAAALAGQEPQSEEARRAHRLARARLLSAQAEIAHNRADAATAAAAAAEVEAIANEYDTPALHARASVARAQAALAGGDPAGALAAATHARTLWQELEMPYETARAQVLAAEARAAAGDLRSAEVDLRAAWLTFNRLGAELDRRHVSEQLETASGPADRFGLSPRELEVLRLVAAGLTDAQIAERLFLSPHTIHRHLSNIRRKTKQPSRSGAVAQAARTGLI